MMSARSAGRSPSPSSLKRRGFFSRMRTPFGQAARHVSEFYIQPDDPHRQYGPGDVVTGSVVLKVAKPMDITHIVVCLHGFAQVYKSPNNPGEGYRSYNAALVAGKTNKAGGYYGNGFVSLFEDEVVLCGDGRLGEGTYQFNFELQFPRDHAPTSIEFERGTVTHMISSTLTRPFRPTTINPTLSCERRITFADDIDIASLLQPKPRIITLEPIVRRAKTRSRRKAHSTAETILQSHGGATDVSGKSQSSSGNGETDRPRSPVMSELSYDDSAQSSGGPPSAAESNAQSTRTNGSRSQSTQRPSGQRKPVTAFIEISRAGFLRGDNIDIRIQVNHTKQVKSLHGIIVTLYRQARVDLHPALPLATGRGDDVVHPKSRNGLGGLSFSSSSGSCHMFRKDLDQSFASLIVNPETLFAEIKTAVRVPEDCFPTVSTVPGAMISFKYHVEVILDLQGKLTGLDKTLPTPGTSGGAAMFRGGVGQPAPAGMFVPWGAHCINTADIRREKSVVSSNFEIVIGTRDSERSRQWGDFPLSSDHTNAETGEQPQSSRDVPEADPSVQHTNLGSIPYRSSADPHTSPRVPDYERPPRTAFPLPNMFGEGALSEKEQARQYEHGLLPSRPPDEAESSASASHAPSAPALADLQTVSGYSAPNGADFGMPPAPRDLSSAPDVESTGPSAPAYDQHTPPPVSTTDDKQETQRRNLEAERSAPDTLPESSAGAEAGPSAPPHASSSHDFSPSAPLLSNDDAFGFEAPESQHSLPKYER